jgi:hypothetical protein
MKRKIKLKERIFMNIKFLSFISIFLLLFPNFTLGAEVKILVMDGGGQCNFCNFITDLEKEGYSIFAPACDVPSSFKIQNLSYSFISKFNILILRSAEVEGKEWNEDVKRYVEMGGKLIIISDTENFYSSDNPTNHLASMWGVEFSGDKAGGAETIDHPITKNVKQVSWCRESDTSGIHLCFDGIPSTHPKEAIVLARYKNNSALILLKDKKGEVIFGPNNGIMDNKELLLNIFRYFTLALAVETPQENRTRIECPPCPSPTEWSECIEGKQNRTVYECSEETYYECKARIEEKECEEALTPSCKEDEIYNSEIKECIKKGIGCFKDEDCFKIYKNESVTCYGATYRTGTPGHCCLKGEIWNGTHCEEKKFRIVAIPYRKSWKELGLNKDKVKETLQHVMKYFPVKSEKIKIVIWDEICEPSFPVILGWQFCPLSVGAGNMGDRFVMIGETTGGECSLLPVSGLASCAGTLSVIVDAGWFKIGNEDLIIAHELGHTFGLKDEYCHYKHIIYGWLCGTEAYPNPLKEEYGCRVFPLPSCGVEEESSHSEKILLEVEKQEISPCEWVRVRVKNLKGNICQWYRTIIRESTDNKEWKIISNCFVDSDGKGVINEPCYISFSENQKGKHILQAFLTPDITITGSYSSGKFELSTNTIEVNVDGPCIQPKVWGESCSEDKLPISLLDLQKAYSKAESLEKPIWLKVIIKNAFNSTINGNMEIYDEECKEKIETISGKKELALPNGIYNFKISSLTYVMNNQPHLEDLGFCCSEVNTYADSCVGNKAISGGGRSIMAAYYQTAFSQPAWEHLKKVLKEWEE